MLLISGLAVFSQTQYFRDILKAQIERAVSSATNQTFTIEEIEGNFFSGFAVNDISLKIDGEHFLTLQKISVNYSLPLMFSNSMILRGNVPISNVSTSGLNLNLIKEEDGSWNFDKLSGKKESKEKEEEVEKKEKKSSRWSVFLQSVLLQENKIQFEDRTKGETTTIEATELDFGIDLIGITNKIDLELRNADIEVNPQNIVIKGLSTDVFFSEGEARIEDLKAKLNDGEIRINAEVSDFRKPKFIIKASALGLKMKDIGVLNAKVEGRGQYRSNKDIEAEMDIKLTNSVVLGKKADVLVQIKMEGTKAELTHGSIKTGFGEAIISGEARLDRILTKEGLNQFDLNLLLNNIKTYELIDIIEKRPDSVENDPSASLNANLTLNGDWKEFDEIKVNARIDELNLKGEKVGKVDLKGTAEASRSNVKVDINSKLENFNLSVLLANEKYKSDLNTSLALKGTIPLKGDILKGLTASVNGEILPSTIFDLKQIKGKIDVSYNKDLITVSSLSLTSDSLEISAKGNVEGTGFSFEAEVPNLNFISKISPELDFSGSLKAQGTVEGRIASPNFNITSKILDLSYKDEIQVESIDLAAEGVFNADYPQIQAKADIQSIKYKDKDIRSINFNAKNEGKGIVAELSITETEERNFNIDFTLADIKGKEKDIEINNIKLNLKNTIIQNKDRIDLIIGPEKLIVRSFNLYYNDSSVVGNAEVNFKGNININLEQKGLNLALISETLEFEEPLEGIVTGSINVSGTMLEPIIKTNINVSNLKFRELELNSLNSDINYLGKRLNLNINADQNSKEILTISGNVNVDLNFKEIGKNLQNASLNLSISLTRIDLSPISGLIDEIKIIEGNLITNVKVTGNIKRPVINGQVKLVDVNLRLHSLRNELKIESGLLEFQGQNGFLKLVIITDDGDGTFDGDIDLSTLSFNLNGKMNRFLIKPKGVSARLDGSLKVKGNDGKISINGDIKVPRTRINIPEEPPKKLPDIKFVDEEEKEKIVIEDTKKTDFFVENIAIDLKASMPRNAWIRGKGANIEVEGDFDIEKGYGEELRLFGTVKTIRGTYKVLGKVFFIEKGTVSFRGMPEINPLLDLQALHKVSNVKVFINISGTAKKPKLIFSSDPPMQETDIISYIVFGTSSDKIGADERNSLQSTAAGLAGGIAAQKLQSLVGENISPDVLRMGTGEQGTEFEVGKYLTDDLYVSYNRGISESTLETTNLLTDWVFIEYYFFNFLSVESQIGNVNSGADLFYNFNF
ncbi:translocation/assembly module TamB [Desulfobacterota bacterium AH_259_B03_O07]|nr:translocation/assembly module TamB [Desulfobacterota bacterium AH_259_B03_O07]